MTSIIICALVVWFCVSFLMAAYMKDKTTQTPLWIDFAASAVIVACAMGAIGGSVIGLVLLVRMAVGR